MPAITSHAHGKTSNRVPVDLPYSLLFEVGRSQYSSLIEAIKLTIKSKSLPGKVNSPIIYRVILFLVSRGESQPDATID